uniref:CASP-like protein n=1 Tax=Daucus carota subsp. sativus TaxID=79200 RepID=A0A166B3Z9_DAUCS
MKPGALEFRGSTSTPKNGVNRGVSVLDFVLRLVGIIATLASAITMATTYETLPFATRFIRFRAEYNDLPSLTFFVAANSVVMLGLLTGGASAAAAIVYLAHKGNSRANWLAICRQFNSFCERVSGSLIGSFVGISVFVLLIILSAVALPRRSSHH